MRLNEILNGIKWLGHASLLLNIDNKNIYIDPWKLKEEHPKADIILVTHSHFDHYSEEDINKIKKEDSILFSSEDVVNQTSLKNKKVIKPFEEVKIDNILIKGFPAYNINKDFHPKKNNWLGFIIEKDGISVYIAGDTDVIEEMKKLKVNIAILPVGGTYTMTESEAAEIVNEIKPDIAIPIHWGDIVGSIENAKRFKELVKPDINVNIIQPLH